jgi:hypothetical protein
MAQTNIGRNDPCHCGSGKKYKKCCLAKDEEAKQAANAELGTTAADSDSSKEVETRRKEVDPHIEVFNARLKDFEAADYEGKFSIFNRTLDDPELMDGEMAFEMLHDLFRYTNERGERNRFSVLVESLREHLPETYAAEASFFLKWRIINALVQAGSGDVASLFLELAQQAGKDIDIFNRAEEMIAYHGQLSALVDAMRLAWPKVKSSGNVVSWGVDEFCMRAISYELLHFANHTPGPIVPNTGLLERLEFYSEIDPELISKYLSHLTGQDARTWTMNDFVLSPPRRKRWEEEDDNEEATGENTIQKNGEVNLHHLTIGFLGYLRRVEGVPYSKGELGRRELHQFILDRHNGKLEYRESMLQSTLRDIDRRKGRKLPPIRKYCRYENILLPDPERLDHYLAGLLDMINQLYHRASALFEIIPAWLRFLEMHRLIDAEARTQTLSHLAPLAGSLGRIFNKYIDDPGPCQALNGWREKAET